MRSGSTALEKAIIEKLRSVKKPKWLGEFAGARTGITYWTEGSLDMEGEFIVRGPTDGELHLMRQAGRWTA